MATDGGGYSRHRLVVAFVVGTAFFGVLPIFATPIVLQAEQIPVFVVGLGASAVAGAVLGVVLGGVR